MTVVDTAAPASPVPTSPQPDDIVAAVRDLVPRLRERARQTELDRRISPETMAECQNTGVFRLMQPRRFGGYEYPFSTFVRVQVELGRGCGSTAWAAGISALHNWLVGLFPLEAQEEVWADPAALINGAYAPTGVCEAVDGGYRVSGSWSWASNCDYAQWLVVSAFLPKSDPAGPPAAAWFLVPRSAIRIDDDWFASGMAGTGSKTIAIDEPVFVPSHRTLSLAEMNSGAAPGSRVNANMLYRLTFFGTAPFTLCSVPLGIATGAVETFSEMAQTKMTSRPGAPPVLMATLPHVQLALSEAAAIVDALTLLIRRDVEEIDAFHARGEMLGAGERIRHRRDHSFIAKEAARAVDVLYDALGASGGMLSSPIQRAWRDVNLVNHHLSLSWPMVGTMYGQYATGQKPVGTF
jgi:alkylation response protein AidB-like acyl-CoA dehydrogenase